MSITLYSFFVFFFIYYFYKILYIHAEIQWTEYLDYKHENPYTSSQLITQISKFENSTSDVFCTLSQPIDNTKKYIYAYGSAITSKGESNFVNPRFSFSHKIGNDVYFCSQKVYTPTSSQDKEKNIDYEDTSTIIVFKDEFDYNSNISILDASTGIIKFDSKNQRHRNFLVEFETFGKDWIVFPFVIEDLSSDKISNSQSHPLVWVDHVNVQENVFSLNFGVTSVEESLNGIYEVHWIAFPFPGSETPHLKNSSDISEDYTLKLQDYQVHPETGFVDFNWPAWDNQSSPVGVCSYIKFTNEYDNLPSAFITVRMAMHDINTVNTDNSKISENIVNNSIFYWIEHLNQKGMTMCASITNNLDMSQFSSKSAQFHYFVFEGYEDPEQSLNETYEFITPYGKEACLAYNNDINLPFGSKYFKSIQDINCTYNHNGFNIDVSLTSWSLQAAEAWQRDVYALNFNHNESEEETVRNLISMFGQFLSKACKYAAFDLCDAYMEALPCPIEGQEFNSYLGLCRCIGGYYSENKCKQCESGTYPNEYQQCVACNADEGFLNNGVCYSCNKGKYDPTRKSCLCQEGYHQDYMGICNKCSKGYGKNFDYCLPPGDNLYIDQNDFAHCMTGYGWSTISENSFDKITKEKIIITKRICVACEANQYTDETSQCIECHGDIINGQCVCQNGLFPPYCTTCKSSDDSFYLPYNGSCYECSHGSNWEGCICPMSFGFQLDNYGKCISCDGPKNYIDDNGYCQTCLGNKVYSSDLNKCICPVGYGYTSIYKKECVKCIDQSVDQEGFCQKNLDDIFENKDVKLSQTEYEDNLQQNYLHQPKTLRGLQEIDIKTCEAKIFASYTSTLNCKFKYITNTCKENDEKEFYYEYLKTPTIRDEQYTYSFGNKNNCIYQPSEILTCQESILGSNDPCSTSTSSKTMSALSYLYMTESGNLELVSQTKKIGLIILFAISIILLLALLGLAILLIFQIIKNKKKKKNYIKQPQKIELPNDNQQTFKLTKKASKYKEFQKQLNTPISTPSIQKIKKLQKQNIHKDPKAPKLIKIQTG